MPGHTDTVTGMSLSPDGSFVLTNSMDNTLRIWDVRPYAPQERCTTVLLGHTHNFEKNLLKCTWSPDGGMVSAGSSDRFVNVWDTESGRILYKLPGHLGSVNDVDFHKMEPISKYLSNNSFLAQFYQNFSLLYSSFSRQRQANLPWRSWSLKIFSM